MLLNLAGELAIEVFDTFSFEEAEVDKPQVLWTNLKRIVIQNEI